MALRVLQRTASRRHLFALWGVCSGAMIRRKAGQWGQMWAPTLRDPSGRWLDWAQNRPRSPPQGTLYKCLTWIPGTMSCPSGWWSSLICWYFLEWNKLWKGLKPNSTLISGKNTKFFPGGTACSRDRYGAAVQISRWLHQRQKDTLLEASEQETLPKASEQPTLKEALEQQTPKEASEPVMSETCFYYRDRDWDFWKPSLDIKTGIETFENLVLISRPVSRLLELQSWYRDWYWDY